MSNRPQRNHNPVNLRYAKQTEATGQDEDGFAVFPDDPAGFRAGLAQIQLDQKRGLSVGAFVQKFAPPGENDTEHYTTQVCSGVRSEPHELLENISKYALVGVMANIEGYFAK